MPHLPSLADWQTSQVAHKLAQVLHIATPVSNGMQFDQIDDMSYFLMDESQTFGNPDPPHLGSTVFFNLGGIWTQPVDIDHINFKCHLFGALVYNEDFADVESVQPGGWTYSLPFDVPSVAPSTTYYITIEALAQDGSSLFEINTNFKFA